MSTADISMLSWTTDLYESQNAVHVVTSPLNFGNTSFGKRVLACDVSPGDSLDGLGIVLGSLE